VDRLDHTHERTQSHLIQLASNQVSNPGISSILRQQLSSGSRLKVDVHPEDEFFKTDSSATLFEFVAYVVRSIMEVGAMFGSMNVMYTSTHSRVLEIATLRTLGFRESARRINRDRARCALLRRRTRRAIGQCLDLPRDPIYGWINGKPSERAFFDANYRHYVCVMGNVYRPPCRTLPPAIQPIRIPIGRGLGWES